MIAVAGIDNNKIKFDKDSLLRSKGENKNIPLFYLIKFWTLK